jgi:hypothetical protein
MKSPFEPYTIETDFLGLNTDLADELVAAAMRLELYPSTFEATVRVESDLPDVGFTLEHRTTPCHRHLGCDMVIWPDNLHGAVAHLTRDHGYRMDGHQYDNENQVIA